MEFETNERTDGQTRTVTTSTDRHRVDVAATRDKRTDGQTPRIIRGVFPPVRFKLHLRDGRTDGQPVRPSVRLLDGV